MKIYVIGLPRTGTTSMKHALIQAGYRMPCDFQCGDQLTTPTERFKRFSNRNPRDKFILTIRRSPHEWIQSVKQRSLITPNLDKTRIARYGAATPDGNEYRYATLYVNHIRSVCKHFDIDDETIEMLIDASSLPFIDEDRLISDRLLIFRTGIDGTAQIAKFLRRKDVGDKRYPHRNKSDNEPK